MKLMRNTAAVGWRKEKRAETLNKWRTVQFSVYQRSQSWGGGGSHLISITFEQHEFEHVSKVSKILTIFLWHCGNKQRKQCLAGGL